jgi:chorismate-pyruvate lyase
LGNSPFGESLREVETCLRSRHDQLYHLGLHGEVSHSTLADANRERDWRIYYDLAQLLIRRARVLYHNEPMGLELNETFYALGL